MGWGPKETRLFVKLYLDHKCLWNVEDEDYKQNDKRLEALRDISRKYNALTNNKLNESEIRSKIKSLRSTYTQYLQKYKRERRPIDSVFSSSPWLEDFHKCFSSNKIPRSFYEDMSSDEQQATETDVEDPSQKNWVPNGLEADSCDELQNSFLSPSDDNYILLLKNEPDDDESEEKYSYKRKRKYRPRSCERSSMKPSISTNNVTSSDDEFDIYGKYIASQLREMSLERALRTQLEIQNIVSEARLESFNDVK